MKFTTKMYLGFAIPAFILIGVGAYALSSFKSIDRQISTIYDDRVVPLQQLKVISDQYGINVIDAVNKTEQRLIPLEEALRSIEIAEQAIEANWQAYLNTQLTGEEQQLANEIDRLFIQADQEIAALKQALREADRERVAEFDGHLYEVIDPITVKIQHLADLQLQVAQQERQKAAAVYQSTVGFFVLLLITSLIMASPMGLWVSRSIIRTLQETIAILTQTASEIAVATTQQENTAVQQAASVNQTTATMSELNIASQQTALQAEESNIRAKQALSQSDIGMKVVEETLKGMEILRQNVTMIAAQAQELQTQTDQIGSITALVSDLAGQTNMLALNAAIEAVRAGEQGQGFAVVAGEIRKLASRSRSSAAEIGALISDIQRSIQATASTTQAGKATVQDGMQRVQNTAKAFDQIKQEIQNVVISTQQISLTAKQQAIGIQQVMTAMNTLNQATGETANSIRQTQLGTQSLKDTATRLAVMVSDVNVK